MKKQKYASLIDESSFHPSDYCRGYVRGLRRAFHGDDFGTQEDHEKWLSLRSGPRAALGIGYEHGLHQVDPWWRQVPEATRDNIGDLIELLGGTVGVCQALGVADRTVRRWRSGANLPPPDVLMILWEEAFGSS